MAAYHIIQGTTTPLRFQLLEAGSPINLLGATVEIMIADRRGTSVTNPGTVTVTNATNGKVEFVPANATVFSSSNGPYSIRWKITESGQTVYYVPSGARDIWNIIGA
jgi:hypothetical protein